jgi:hypothetical protein
MWQVARLHAGAIEKKLSSTPASKKTDAGQQGNAKETVQ